MFKTHTKTPTNIWYSGPSCKDIKHFGQNLKILNKTAYK